MIFLKRKYLYLFLFILFLFTNKKICSEINNIKSKNDIEKIKKDIFTDIKSGNLKELKVKINKLEQIMDINSLLFDIEYSKELGIEYFNKEERTGYKLYFGCTILHIAVLVNNLELIKYLIEDIKINIDPDQTEFGAIYGSITPLHFACMYGRKGIAKYLIEHGADIYINTKYDEFTILHAAAMGGLNDIIVYLLEKGLDINCEFNLMSLNGQIPLHYATLNGNNETVKLLVKYGANVNKINSQGQTPLHYAVSMNNYELVKFLIDNGSNVNISSDPLTYFDSSNETPLDIAIKNKFDKIIILLKNYGAIANIYNK